MNKRKTIADLPALTVTYRAFAGKWWPWVTDCHDNGTDGYAGVRNRPLTALQVCPAAGTVRLRLHRLGGDWLPWVEDPNAYAGIPGVRADALQLCSADPAIRVQYRVSSVGRGWYAWCTDCTDPTGDGYAGVFGRPLDRVQIRLTGR